jgi:hypothetical protein
MDPMPESLARLDKELSRVRSWPRLEPGLGAVVVAVAVMLLLGAIALPWVGGTSGWSMLITGGPQMPGFRGLPRLFAGTAVFFGVIGSATALLTRLWAVGWACALGCGFSVVNGLWAIWSRQTAPAGTPGPGLGLILTLLAMILLSALWVRLAWTRPGGRAPEA